VGTSGFRGTEGGGATGCAAARGAPWETELSFGQSTELWSEDLHREQNMDMGSFFGLVLMGVGGFLLFCVVLDGIEAIEHFLSHRYGRHGRY